MEIIYKVNGKEFNTQEQAKDYELELERKEQERIEKEQAQEKRLKELCDAEDRYEKLREEYYKDYPIESNKTKVVFRGNKEVEDIVNDLLKFFN